MTGDIANGAAWPELPKYSDWEESCTTVHMWTQIVGKVRLELSPNINHWWGITLYVTARGLTTSPIPYPSGSFSIDFDFVDHALVVKTSLGEERRFKLAPMSVAEFYGRTMATIQELWIEVKIFARPVEIVEAIPFAQDTKHCHYDPDAIHRFWTALVRVESVFAEFRSRFIGKSSPVHLFWGAFDLAVTRFSGRPAPKHPGGIPNCADWVMAEAYSHEVSSAGFWAGAGLGEAAFYSYAYPNPSGFNRWAVQPETAYFHEGLGEFILPYDAIRESHPRTQLLTFLQSTYEAAATLANWDRETLETTSS
jgi:hypothetical protein